MMKLEETCDQSFNNPEVKGGVASTAGWLRGIHLYSLTLSLEKSGSCFSSLISY